MNKTQWIEAAKQVVIYFAIFMVISIVIDYWRGQKLPSTDLPHHVLTDMADKPIDLIQLSQGDVSVIYFWATWCAPCTVSTPSVKGLAKNFPVVSIALRSETTKELEQAILDKDITFPVVNDLNGEVSAAWGVAATPTILFVKNGQVVGHTSGVSFYPGLWLRAWWLRHFA